MPDVRAEDTPTLRPIRGDARAWLVGAVVGTGLVAVLGHGHLAIEIVAQLLGAAVCVPAAIACVQASQVTRSRWSSGWQLLAWSSAWWAAANLVTVLSVLLPGRGLSSAIYPLQAVSMAAVLAALLVLPRPRWQPGQALRAWLDVGVLVSSLALLGAVALLDAASASSSGADLAFAIAYVLTSLAMLGLAYELSRRHVHTPRPELALLAGVFGLWLAAAAVYASLTPAALIAPAGVSWLVAAGVVLLTLAGRMVTRTHPQRSVELGSVAARVVLAVPEVAVVVTAVTVIFTGLERGGQQVLAAAVASAVLVRHALVTADSRRLHWHLESEVAERTADLQHLTERYVRILDAVGDGILSTDASGRIGFANASARTILGATQEELLGRGACEALCVVVPRHDCEFAEVRRGRSLRGVEAQLRRRDGGVVPVELHAAPEHRGPREPGRGSVIVFRDVSQRHAVEQVKRQFVSSVSHELRTPLTSVRGVLELLVDGDVGELSPVGHSLAAGASRGVERLSRLVDDIIDAEKLATGQFRLQCSRVALGRLLDATVSGMQPWAHGLGVRVAAGEEGSEEGSAEIWGDADRVEQALVNLVGNAVKFSPRGGLVTVASRVRDGSALVTVRDEGPGIPHDQREHVFERFHQIALGDASDKGGTGLGLTITRSIVRQHGGNIWVEGAPGGGADFCFTLPLASPGARLA